MKAVNEINKNCPIAVDKDTRLDNTMALPKNTMLYNYTLINYTLAELDTTYLINYIRPGMVNFIKSSPDMTKMRALDCTFSYKYKDKNAVYAFSITITPKDYK